MTSFLLIFPFFLLLGRLRPALQDLSREARISRLGEILAEGVSSYIETTRLDKTSMPSIDCPLPCRDSDVLLLLELRKFPLSPREIQARFSYSRSTSLRAVKRLKKAQLVESQGKTSGTKIVLNSKGRRLAERLKRAQTRS